MNPQPPVTTDATANVGELLAETAVGPRPAEEFLSGQNVKLDEIEAEILLRLAELSSAAAIETSSSSHDPEATECRSQQLAEQYETLVQLKQSLVAQQAHWLAVQQQHAGRQHDLAERLCSYQIALEARREALDAQSDRTQSALGEATHEKVAELSQLRDAILKRRAGTDAGSADSADAPEAEARIAELERQFEAAVADVREFKQRNAELEEQLNRSRSSSGPQSSTGARTSAGSSLADAGDGKFDWESQKRRMLAEFDDESTTGSEAETQDRLTIEGTIRITDEVVAEKEREIAKLRHELEKLAAEPPSDTAIRDAIDADEIVQQEREKLRALQEEHHDKLREAEVEIAVQRARIAREKAELERRLQELALERSQDADDAGDDPAGTPNRGRWLSRLGLVDLDEE